MTDQPYIDVPAGRPIETPSAMLSLDGLLHHLRAQQLERERQLAQDLAALEAANARRAIRQGVSLTRIHPDSIADRRREDVAGEGNGFDFI